MNKHISNISIIVALSLFANTVFSQTTDAKKRLLVRDSLDYKTSSVGINSTGAEFNPIPYKGGLLFVSNNKSKTNLLGFNKVYWVPQNLLGNSKNDSTMKSKFSVNDEFTAPTSNDNNILTHYTRRRARLAMNAIEQEFSDFNPDRSFAFNDSSKLVVYPLLGKKKINRINRWELWQANLKNGRLTNEKRISILDSAADYLNPFLTNNADTLYFSSNRNGGKGGFDIYSLYKKNGVWDKQPNSINAINTDANEIYPIAKPDTLLYTSDRIGGLGGYDMYQYALSAKVNMNAGYPINSVNDDLGLVNLGSQYYLTSNRNGSVDIAAIQYSPVTIVINGQLIYANDKQLAPNQKLYIFDKDENVLVDSLITDQNAFYQFTAKPNRNYLASTINADGINENIAFATNDKLIQKVDIALNLIGRSPKQIKDSNEMVWAIAEKKRQDSLAAFDFANKFVVYFGFDKKELVKKEKLVLDSLYNKLKSMPNSNIIVGAFTDCIGSYKYNYQLSVNRAKFVVNYLKYKGIAKNRFVSNGYSKNYTITPCKVGVKKSAQQNNRRAEIVLSEAKNTNWASLEKERGNKYYNLVSSKQNIKPLIVKTLAKVVTKEVIKKDSIAKVAKVIKPIVIEKKKDTVAKVAKIVKPIVVEKKKDTVAKMVKIVKPLVIEKKKDSVVTVAKVATVVKDNIIVATASTYKEEYSKEDIIKALDSLANLKKEQERIVEYMTKRINKKPIEILVSSDSVTVEIYDNGIHDKDSVSIIYNNRILVDRQELKVNKPIKFKLKVDANKKNNELVMVAENLGAEPPNTAVMFITEKSGRRQQVMLATDMTHNEVVYFIRIGKQ